MRAVVYTRASLDRTGEGKSTERQYEECERLIDYKRWDLVAHESDVSISAYGEKDRPAWNAVLALVASGDVDVVVAWHLDRLTRNMADLEKLILVCEKYNVLVATATGDIDLTNDTGRMVARILAAVARQEVERKAARQRLAHVQRRKEGRPWAGVKMLGYARDGSIIEQEASAIREAADDVIERRATLADIGRRWQELGLTSPYKSDDKAWSAPGVKKILTNPRIAGLITTTTKDADGRKVMEVLGEGRWEPILSENTLTVVTAILNDSERINGKVRIGPKASNLLTGVMKCAKCEATVRAGSKRGVPSYMCPEYHAQVNRAEADALVRASFAAAVATSAPGSVVPTGFVRADAEDVAKEMAALQERQEVVARSYLRGVISKEAHDSLVEEVEAALAALESSLTGTAEALGWEKVRAGSVQQFMEKAMHAQREALLRYAVVTLSPGVRGRAGAKRQIEVQVKAKRGNADVLIPAFIPETQKAPQH